MSELMQTQCWICPHCYDDAHHQSDENGCEWQYKRDSIDAKRYRFLREVTFNQSVCSGSVHAVFMPEKFDYLHLSGIDLDKAVDKAMGVL